LVNGVIIRRRVLMNDLPNDIRDAKVVCLEGDIKIRDMVRDAELKITSADDLDSFIGAERERKQEIFHGIRESGARVVLCSGEIDKDILHMLCDSGILAVEKLDSSELRNASDATGSRIIENPLDIEEADMGFCGSATWARKESTDEVQDTIRIEDCLNPSIVTIEVGGAGEVGTEEVIRGLHDSLRATSLALCEDVLTGAGSTHSRIAHAVRAAAESQGGRERLAMEAFARAMETIPATLVENAGGEPLDRVLELRSTSLTEAPVGISEDGKIWEVEDVWHPRSVIENSLEAATETAMGMLRIDQVISARGE
jgi:chaperonin GroEL (HSP60 family)